MKKIVLILMTSLMAINSAYAVIKHHPKKDMGKQICFDSNNKPCNPTVTPDPNNPCTCHDKK